MGGWSGSWDKQFNSIQVPSLMFTHLLALLLGALLQRLILRLLLPSLL